MVFLSPVVRLFCPYCLCALSSGCNNPDYRFLVVNPRLPEGRDGPEALSGIVRVPIRPALQTIAAMFS